MKKGWKENSVGPGRIMGVMTAILCFAFAMMVTDAKAPSDLDLPEVLPTPARAEGAAETGVRIQPQCQITQTMGFSRCGHSVTRRIAPPEEMTGATFEEARAYYDLWQIGEFSPSRVVMQREIPLFCPMHQVLGVNEAGDVVIMQNEYGDGMAAVVEYEKNLRDFDEDIQEQLRLGIGFESREEAEAWLAIH